MCHVCDRMLDRRSVLRRAIIGGSAIAGGAVLVPRGALAMAAGNALKAPPSLARLFETAAMGEDRDTGHALERSGSIGRGAQLLWGTRDPAPALLSASLDSVRGVRIVPAPNANALPAPSILSRRGWGANEAIRVDTRSYAPVRKLIDEEA